MNCLSQVETERRSQERRNALSKNAKICSRNCTHWTFHSLNSANLKTVSKAAHQQQGQGSFKMMAYPPNKGQTEWKWSNWSNWQHCREEVLKLAHSVDHMGKEKTILQRFFTAKDVSHAKNLHKAEPNEHRSSTIQERWTLLVHANAIFLITRPDTQRKY